LPFTDEQIKLACELNKDGLEWFRICDLLNIPKEEKERLRSACRRSDKYKSGVALAFGCVHIPFTHENFYEFLYDTAVKYHCDKIICVGDLIDHHDLSRHDSEPDSESAEREWHMAMESLERLKTIFPEMDITLGNHDLIPRRQAAKFRLSDRYVKSLAEAYSFPSTWTVQEELIYNDVIYAHGIGGGGKTPALNHALKNRASSVIAHWHSCGGINYQNNGINEIFGLSVGCGIDKDSYAMRYGKSSMNKVILGCGIIKDSENAEFVRMPNRYR
jgi:hypothetical protein